MNWAAIWLAISIVLFVIILVQHLDNKHAWNGLIKELHRRNEAEHELITWKAKFAIGLVALKDIRDQNEGQRTFEIWAKQRAKVALERMEKHGK